ncbi:MAG: threonine/serine dehydratase, partial [Nitratireductor sp.]
MNIPTYKDVQIAAKRIEDAAMKTPLLNFSVLDDLIGAKIWLKAETLQVTGAFKFRGAYNAIKALTKDVRANGVVAASSGNHAQAIAKAASMFDIPSYIVMPQDTPQIKLDRTRAFGASVILYDRYNEDRIKIATDIAAKKQTPFIHPYEHFEVIAGQGTCGLEICETLKAQNETLDHVLVCTGGGGLMAGITLCVNKHFPNAKIHSCEPLEFDDYARSIQTGKREDNNPDARSICDAIVTPSPGINSFAICASKLSTGLVASDSQVLNAVAYAFNELKLVVEPGGAIALACLLQNKQMFKGKTIALTLSGGNIDPQILNKALQVNAQEKA